MCFKIKGKQLCIYEWKPLDPFKGAKTDFCIFFFTNIGGFFIMKEVVFKIYNFNSLFRGVKAIFWAKVVSEV